MFKSFFCTTNTLYVYIFLYLCTNFYFCVLIILLDFIDDSDTNQDEIADTETIVQNYQDHFRLITLEEKLWRDHITLVGLQLVHFATVFRFVLNVLLFKPMLLLKRTMPPLNYGKDYHTCLTTFCLHKYFNFRYNAFLDLV